MTQRQKTDCFFLCNFALPIKDTKLSSFDVWLSFSSSWNSRFGSSPFFANNMPSNLLLLQPPSQFGVFALMVAFVFRSICQFCQYQSFLKTMDSKTVDSIATVCGFSMASFAILACSRNIRPAGTGTGTPALINLSRIFGDSIILPTILGSGIPALRCLGK